MSAIRATVYRGSKDLPFLTLIDCVTFQLLRDDIESGFGSCLRFWSLESLS